MKTNFKHQLRTRQQDRARKAREAAKARRRCTDAVWLRAGDGETGRCERTWLRGGRVAKCGNVVHRAHHFFALVGHVHEVVTRAKGGDPHDPENCQLLCHSCHFNGPSGAHRASERPHV